MPVHDWTRVDAGIFHGFHTRWIVYLASVLNRGVLPKGYLADCEQIVIEPDPDDSSKIVPDLVALRSPVSPRDGGTALLDRMPAARAIPVTAARPPQRHIAVRHRSGREVVALIEIVSPANKDRAEHLDKFVSRVVGAVERGVSVVVIDLFPPRRHDPDGINDVILRELYSTPDELPATAPLTVASYIAGLGHWAFAEHFAVGEELPTMPLFLSAERYVEMPLAQSYRTAWDDFPEDWRELVAG